VSLNNSSANARPWAGRDEQFALAMKKVEDRAAGKPLAAKRPGDSIGITRDGWIVQKNGRTFFPEYVPAEKLAHLPIIDPTGEA
jgi:hypothetical protein